MDVGCDAFSREENGPTRTWGDSEAWLDCGEEVITFAADATSKVDVAKVHCSQFCVAKGEFPAHTGPVASDADAGHS